MRNVLLIDSCSGRPQCHRFCAVLPLKTTPGITLHFLCVFPVLGELGSVALVGTLSTAREGRLCEAGGGATVTAGGTALLALDSKCDSGKNQQQG